jgi:LysM repeat protein
MNNQNHIYGTEYIVEKNDNIYSIAERFNTTANILKEINHLNSYIVWPGQTIIVDDLYTPGKKIYKTYIVKADDNIYKIAREYDMTVNELKILNLLENDNLYTGQELIVNNIPDFIDNIS